METPKYNYSLCHHMVNYEISITVFQRKIIQVLWQEQKSNMLTTAQNQKVVKWKNSKYSENQSMAICHKTAG